MLSLFTGLNPDVGDHGVRQTHRRSPRLLPKRSSRKVYHRSERRQGGYARVNAYS
jgi:hypothetical protein